MEPEGSLPCSQKPATYPILSQMNPIHIPKPVSLRFEGWCNFFLGLKSAEQNIGIWKKMVEIRYWDVAMWLMKLA
jgi:hypothetical protein